MSNQSTNVFVSYSHTDASLVAPVVKLLRANKSFVFQDIDSIQPGKKWRSEVAKGLAESDLVVVFWCDHARHSDEVCEEWKAAVEQEKDILPLLLDATPLPPALRVFQWIDFRGTVGANHASIVSPQHDATLTLRFPTPAKSSRWLSFGGLAAILVAVVTGGLLFTWTTRAPQNPVEVSPPPSVGSIPPTSSSPSGVFDRLLSGGILVWLLLLLAVTGFVACWLLRRHWKRKRPPEITPVRFPDLSAIAREIEEEILRRRPLKHDAEA